MVFIVNNILSLYILMISDLIAGVALVVMFMFVFSVVLSGKKY